MKKSTLILCVLLAGVFVNKVSAQFTTTPDTTAMLNEEYVYDANASGASSYSLEKALAGMAIVPSTGVVTWTPTVHTSGGKVIIASSNGYTQEFFIHVASGFKCLTDAISYLKFDETSGTTYEDSYGDHDATAVGTVPFDITGKVKRAKDVPAGNVTGMDVADHIDFHWGTNRSFSISFWFKSDVEDRAVVGVILGRNEGTLEADYHWWTGINENNELTFFVRDPDLTNGYRDAYLSGARLYQNLNWHHVVAVRDAGANKMRLYFDGVLPSDPGASVDYSGASERFASTKTTPLSIGYLKPTGAEANYPMDGSIDELVIYDRVLTAGEISGLFAKGNAGNSACDEGYYAPLFVTTPDSITDEDDTYSYKMIARDLDDDPMNFAVINKPAWLQTSTSANSVTLYGTPTNDNVGKDLVEVNVTAGSVTIKQKFNLEVVNVNDAPVIVKQIDTLTVDPGATVALTLNLLEVTDVDNDENDLSLVIKDGTDYTVNGSNITVASSASLSINVTVAVSDGTDESEDFELYVKIHVQSAIKSLEEVETKFYPNPVSEVIHFELPIAEAMNFELFDLLGNLVKSKKLEAGNTGKFELDIRALPAGVYTFKLSNNSYYSTGKFSVAR